jgi:octaprenyl-diphosphate synthase
MSEGELIQLSKINDYSLTDEEYYLIIQSKTADLFGACMYLGAYSSGASKEDLKCLECIGKEVGTAFQINDDLKDYNLN